MTIFQILTLIAVALVVLLTVKSINDRFAVYISIAVALLVLFFVCSRLSLIFGFVDQLADRAGIRNQYFEVIIKGLSICYLGEFTISSCKDCGQSGWVDKVDLACRCALLVLAIPLFEDLLDVLTGLLE